MVPMTRPGTMGRRGHFGALSVKSPLDSLKKTAAREKQAMAMEVETNKKRSIAFANEGIREVLFIKNK